MSEENANNKSYKEGWPLNMPSHKNTPHWVKCAITAIGILLAFFLVAALLISLFYLSVEIINSYFKKEEASNIRSTILILTAVLGASGIPLFIWRTTIAYSQAGIARDRAYTELFTKAIEQLGTDKVKKEEVLDAEGKPVLDNAGQPLMREIYVPNIEVRIGAIYALERIMKESKKDAPAIVDTLAAYVRENCGKPTLECKIPEKKFSEPIGEWLAAIQNYIGIVILPKKGTLVDRAKALAEQPQVNRVDIKTALTVIGRRPVHLKNPKDFEDERTTMPDLRNVNFQGWDLRNFDLSHCNLSGAKMQGANFHAAQMQGAKLLGAQMQGTNLNKANIQRANISGSDLQGASLNFAKMQRAKIIDADMNCAEFGDAQMQGINLSLSKIQGTKLLAAKMQRSNLQDAQIHLADLSFAKFDSVQITSALKTAASVIGVDFTKTDFDFEELQAQLPEMFGHKKHTILPDGMKPPDHWSDADMETFEGRDQYKQDWQAFRKKMGLE